MATILQTERTVVDQISIDDAPFFVTLVNSPDWVKFIGERNVSDIADARRFLEKGFLRSYREYGFGYYLVRTSDGKTPIGICGLLKSQVWRIPILDLRCCPNIMGKDLLLNRAEPYSPTESRLFSLPSSTPLRCRPTNGRSACFKS